ncbi:hypothetical protein HP532_05945 [Pseudomonas sp. CrR25]|nr:hypothetical protein [Pseudomonas sp. CrR25]
MTLEVRLMALPSQRLAGDRRGDRLRSLENNKMKCVLAAASRGLSTFCTLETLPANKPRSPDVLTQAPAVVRAIARGAASGRTAAALLLFRADPSKFAAERGRVPEPILRMPHLA